MKEISKKLKHLCYISILISLTSCLGNDLVQIETNSRPFTVEKIEYYDDTHELYVHTGWSNHEFRMFFSYYPKVLAPKGSFNMGDTLTFKCNKNTEYERDK